MGEGVSVVVATKYVSVAEMAALADAGVEVVGENRAQDLERKHATYGDAFRWHFVGHLQSNKVKIVDEICELVHSLSSDSAARRLTIPALLEVKASGDVRGLMTMPPLADDPEASRPYFRRLRELAAENDLPELSMGTSQDYRIAVDEGATLIRVGAAIFAPAQG